jgi:YtkA-like
LLLAVWALASAACSRRAGHAEDVVVEWVMTPAAPIVGREALGGVTLFNRSHQPLPGATLRVEAYMQHPGMAPLLEPAADRGVGAYAARLNFTMAGTWTLLLTGTLPDGSTIRHDLGEVNARTAGQPQ